ncbi:hypothetical protein M406DRAFT_73956 [Cryphonectria parasitica EP155]|uniref:Uncharacterized protein n=1 Tax=Cryphonectria parasitica (strain ATCC 38755 / EP155) TaxID=660469 RepID=A0A9P5CMK1_CRYP1|nr:uncharacterized protein M406DRAFT_73956 [Cryphonectria parasitica EP155]KAF3763337.1 hypothetical protein M406DRAFT_73956 [Cryphonectria parasitica EP155]
MLHPGLILPQHGWALALEEDSWALGRGLYPPRPTWGIIRALSIYGKCYYDTPTYVERGAGRRGINASKRRESGEKGEGVGKSVGSCVHGRNVALSLKTGRLHHTGTTLDTANVTATISRITSVRPQWPVDLKISATRPASIQYSSLSVLESIKAFAPPLS